MSSIQSASARAEYSQLAKRFANFDRSDRKVRTFDATLIGASRKIEQPERDQLTLSGPGPEKTPNPIPIPKPVPGVPPRASATANGVLNTNGAETAAKPVPGLAPLDDIEPAKNAEIDAAAEAGTPSAPGDTPDEFTLEDLASLAQSFGAKSGEDAYDAALDFDGDGLIGLPDLLTVLSGLDEAQTSVSAPGVYTQDDLDAVRDIFGAKRGDDSYNADYDFDNDGTVGLPDLLQVLSGYQHGSDMERLMDSFGSSLGDARYLSEFDSDGDGAIGLPDLLAFLSEQ